MSGVQTELTQSFYSDSEGQRSLCIVIFSSAVWLSNLPFIQRSSTVRVDSVVIFAALLSPLYLSVQPHLKAWPHGCQAFYVIMGHSRSHTDIMEAIWERGWCGLICSVKYIQLTIGSCFMFTPQTVHIWGNLSTKYKFSWIRDMGRWDKMNERGKQAGESTELQNFHTRCGQLESYTWSLLKEGVHREEYSLPHFVTQA